MDTGIESNTFNINRFLRSHIEFVVIGILVGFYLFVSNYFVWSVAFTNGVINTSGGSDPYYNWRIIEYIIHYKHELLFDQALNYPLGARNPRNPFFHWFIIFVAQTVMAPFVGLTQGAYYVFNEFDAAFGAFLIVPVYLITKELFGKKAGFAGAVLYTLMPSNLSSGILADGRMHTPELIFAFFTIYFFLRAISISQKTRIVERISDIKSYVPSILKFYENNRMATIYALLGGASLGGLMLSWQGYPYIEVIVLIYVVIQLIVNVITRKPTGYLTYYTAIFVALGFLMGSYYYIGAGFWQTWYNDPMYMGVLIVGLGLLFNIVGRRPWLLTIPSIIIISALALLVLNQVSPSIVHELLTGQGYFIKSRVYQTISEAQSPPLGQYISGFGAAQFLLGMSGVAYIIYRYTKERKDGLLFMIVFSLVSIYMSLAAARFNVTAAPAYAALGGGILIYFAETIKMSSVRKRKVMAQPTLTKAIKGNISWLHAVFTIIVVLLVIIPSGIGIISAAVPPNNAASINNEIHNSLPSFLRAPNYTASNYQYVGGASAVVVNNTDPLSQSLNWLATQDTNVSLNQRPAYVSWWDYGFQELYQGQHPTVADDFQQGYQVTGQILLAQNQSQIISLFIARVLQGAMTKNNGHFSDSVNNTLNKYFGSQETLMIYNISRNPNNYVYLILNNPSVYGNFISSITAENAYFALIKGQLASKYPTSTIVNAYSELEQETGYSIQYIQVPSNLFPFSGLNPGIFYAPAYLTDTPSYNYHGEIVPTNYYQINAITANGTYQLNQLPSGVQPLNYSIQYTSAFYNTSIYRFMVGYPAYITGNSNGIPGYDYGSTQYQLMPAWNMSHFEISYEGIPYNPYQDYSAHPNAWQLYVPLQQAYQYQQEGKGTAVIFPPASEYLTAANPIVSYYPGAYVSGQVKTSSGAPVQGLYVTIFDQYGIPHQYTTTNKNGFYNLTGLPGNDSIIISSGSFNSLYLTGSNTITGMKIKVTQDQAERIPTSYNLTTGLPSYYIIKNYVVQPASVSGITAFEYQTVPYASGTGAGFYKTVGIKSGFVVLHNSTFNVNYTVPIINGNYSISDVLPYSYNASIISDGATYENVQYVNITVGGTVAYNIYVAYDPIFANVSLNGIRLPGYTVEASGANGQTSGITNSTGQATLWVRPGNYSVYASKSNSRSVPASVSFSTWGQNTSVNLTPAISVELSGYVTNQKGPVSLSFYSNGIVSDNYSVQSSATGYYSINLPIGIYTVYAVGQNGASLKTVNLSTDTSLNLTLQNAYSLTMESYIKGQTVYTGYYELVASNSVLKYEFLANHTFEIQVPESSYVVSGVGIYVGNIAGNFKHIYVSSNTTVNLSLTEKNQKTIFAYSSDYSSYSAGSAVASGIMTMYVSGVPYFYNPLSSQGYVTMLYPNGTSSDLSVGITSTNYYGQIKQISSDTIYYSANPIKTTVTMHIFNSSNSLSTNGVLELSGLNNYNITLSGGLGISKIVPGVYYATIQTSGYLLTPYDPVIVVPAVGSYNADIVVEELASITVNNVQSSIIFNAQGTPFSPGASIPFGSYWVYSTNGSLVSVMQVKLTGNVSITPSLQEGYSINITNSESLSSGTYSVKSSEYVLNFTNGNIILPSGTYNISYLNNVVNGTGAYVVKGYQLVSVGGSLSLNISVSSQDVKTLVSGKIIYAGMPAQYSEIEFLNSTGAVIATTTSNASGYYSMLLPYAKYGMYIINAPSSAGYIGLLSFSAFSKGIVDNITLVPAFKTYVSANVQDQLLAQNITIIYESARLLFNTTQGSLLLPLGNYTFSASQISSQYFSTTNVTRTIGFYTNQTEFINSSKYVHLTLQKSTVYSFVTNQITPIETINAGDNFSYVFTIQNTGNSPVNITLSSGESAWIAEFNQSKAYLIPGQVMNVTVNITSPANAEAGTDTVPITINYGTGTSSAPLSVNVTAFENFTVKEGATAGIPEGNTIKIPILVTNTGNELLTVNLTMLNQTLINKSNWQASFLYNNQTVQQINISYNQTATLYVLMVPINQNAVSSLNFNVNFAGKTTNITQTVTLHYPSLSKMNAYPTGNEIISNYTGSPFLTLEAGILAIVLIVVAGLGLVAYRTRGKK